jgi:phage portal protein BeeE
VKLWQTLLRGRQSAEVSRYDVSAYLEQLNSPWAVWGASSSTTRYGRPTESLETRFDHAVRQAYQGNGVIFAVVLARLLLFTEARFQWRRIRFGETGDLFGTQELSILERPWPNGTTGELLARMEQDASLAGNFYAVREEGRLRRLRPDWVDIVLSAPPEEAVESDVLGYLYTPGGYGASKPQPYLPDEICHWTPIPDPLAQYRGMSWLTPVAREVDADRAATDHKRAFFANGAKPGLVVSLKDTVTAEQFKKFIVTMNDSHQGVDNAYKTLYVGGGADVTVAGADLRQLDFKATQGAGETRICAAGGVPPIIVGLSEGLQSATYSNYGMARRKFGDHWARPTWRSACAALANIVDVPSGAELWFDDSDIAFLREDQKDAAEIQQTKASTIRQYIDAGFEPESAVKAVDSDSRKLLKHSGMYSVQLQAPGAGDDEELADAQLLGAQISAVAAAVQAGFDPDSAVKAVETGDLKKLKHPGPQPGAAPGGPPGAPAGGAGPTSPATVAGRQADLDWGLGGGTGGTAQPAGGVGGGVEAQPAPAGA